MSTMAMSTSNQTSNEQTVNYDRLREAAMSMKAYDQEYRSIVPNFVNPYYRVRPISSDDSIRGILDRERADNERFKYQAMHNYDKHSNEIALLNASNSMLQAQVANLEAAIRILAEKLDELSADEPLEE